VQGRIERAVLHLQKVIRRPLNMLANLVSVRRAVAERPEDEHIQRSLENSHTLFCLLVGGSHSTLKWKGW
jgi:hypothetical protein